MPMLRSYGLRWSTRRSPNRISPPSGVEKPASMRSSVVLPQPEGPSSVKSSPSRMSSVARSTAVTAPKRLTTSRMRMFMDSSHGGRDGPPSPHPLGSAPAKPGRSSISSRLLPGGLDVGAELHFQRIRALGGHGFVVDVGDFLVEVRAHAAREFHRQLRRGAGRA